MKQIFSAVVLSLLLGTVGCRSSGDGAAPSAAAVPVQTAVIAEKLMPRMLPLTGSLVANQEARVAANANGVIIRTFVERGTVVEEGDSIAQVDITAASLTRTQARANRDGIRAQQRFLAEQCRRYDALYKGDNISRAEWERLRAECERMDGGVEAANAQVELTGKMLRDTTVRAPFAGLVQERLVSAGEFVAAPSPVAYLVQITPLKLQLSVPEEMIGAVTTGGEVSFTVAAFPGETFTATVANIAPAVRSTTRDLVFEATVPNADGRLRPGMFVSAALALPDEKLPVVPRKSLREESGVHYLMMVVGGRVEARVVQVGTERDGEVAIMDGVKVGEHYVLLLSDQVKDGTAVR